MMDEETLSFVGVAAKELKEETGIEIFASDLQPLSDYPVYSSPGLLDEGISYYQILLLAKQEYIDKLRGKVTGELNTEEQITLGVVELEEFKKMCVDGRCRDSKAITALWLSESTIQWKPRDIE